MNGKDINFSAVWACQSAYMIYVLFVLYDFSQPVGFQTYFVFSLIFVELSILDKH